jgi:hypothetical protein
VQVVVAENADGGVAKAAHEAQQLQGVGSLVDKIPCKPETVNVRIEVQLLQEPQQVIEAALDVADGVGGRYPPARPSLIRQIEVCLRSVGFVMHSGVYPCLVRSTLSAHGTSTNSP